MFKSLPLICLLSIGAFSTLIQATDDLPTTACDSGPTECAKDCPLANIGNGICEDACFVKEC
jgi:hypothetical protein